MKTHLINMDAPKKPANVSVNANLLEAAKAAKINLSQTLENGLIDLLKCRQEQQWRQESRAAVDEYNNRINKTGAFGDKLRKF